MPYPQLEELCSRKREKVALFLTAEQMAGVFAVALPAYLGTLHTTLWLRVLILLAALGLGLALTSEINGLAFYERVLWRLRGRARRSASGATLRPVEFTVVPLAQGDRALPAGGPVRRMTGGSALAPRSNGVNAAAWLAGSAWVPRASAHQRETDVVRTNGQGASSDAAVALVEDGDADL